MKGIILFFITFLHFIFWLIMFLKNFYVENDYNFYFSTIFWISMLIVIIFMIVIIKKLYLFQKLEYKVQLVNEMNELKEKQKRDIELTIQKEDDKMQKNIKILKEVSILLKDNQYTAAQKKFSLLYDGIQNKETIYYCNNSYVNAILYNKKLLAAQFNIKVNYDIQLPENNDLEIIDLPAILFNILDNGINACKKINQSHINLKIKYNDKYISVYQKNNNDKTVENKEQNLHGYGLKIVEEIVDKYDGICEWTNSEDYFESRIMLKYKREDFDDEISYS